ncbi:uncharacterized protein LOC119559357 isoform X2 [Drosophila subpulchrella]|uniref:uncharacterized protein LOC119559357 isoform X2 n=1 Tax=Drosophila subpulchrella TaxID=1486046 RepID=UPI0018A16342|nr:uncharacterized protein LOC119559357 isoform X2 [Drosophila subpulchrella]XP_037728334.1 uncharacterized protein LOC119559357 isoform X2 [Drosophila subpulchrella]
MEDLQIDVRPESSPVQGALAGCIREAAVRHPAAHRSTRAWFWELSAAFVYQSQRVATPAATPIGFQTQSHSATPVAEEDGIFSELGQSGLGHEALLVKAQIGPCAAPMSIRSQASDISSSLQLRECNPCHTANMHSHQGPRWRWGQL